jgi:hypothetical protein
VSGVDVGVATRRVTRLAAPIDVERRHQLVRCVRVSLYERANYAKPSCETAKKSTILIYQLAVIYLWISLTAPQLEQPTSAQ